MKKLILIGFAAWLFVGCATLRPGGRVVTINDSEPDPDRDDGLAEKAKQVTSADFSRVAIVKGKIPEGILLEESGGKISIDPRFKDEFNKIAIIEIPLDEEFIKALLKKIEFAVDCLNDAIK